MVFISRHYQKVCSSAVTGPQRVQFKIHSEKVWGFFKLRGVLHLVSLLVNNLKNLQDEFVPQARKTAFIATLTLPAFQSLLKMCMA